jgi:hypothetical protein
MNGKATIRAILILFALCLSATAQPQQQDLPFAELPGSFEGRGAQPRVPFKTEAEAQAAGYRKAKNCPQ